MTSTWNQLTGRTILQEFGIKLDTATRGFIRARDVGSRGGPWSFLLFTTDATQPDVLTMCIATFDDEFIEAGLEPFKLAWHPNGQWLAIADGCRCSVWCPDPLAAGTTCERWLRTSQPRCVFAAELARADDPIRWDDYGVGLPEPPTQRWSPWPDIFTVAWSPDGRWVAILGKQRNQI